MFKRLLQNKKAQQTAEYAILIALVVGAVIAMQTYAQRTIQARIRGAALYMTNTDVGGSYLGTELQYEPYYLDQQYTVTRDEGTSQTLNPLTNKSIWSSDQTRQRATSGYQATVFNKTGTANW